jgi:hypothetical protein
MGNGIHSYNGVHLFVLVHGFEGSSNDMKLLRNNLVIVYSDAMVLCSTANDNDTKSGIGEMGERLAGEVRDYIAEYCPGNILGRISFIGHSLGGLIIRAALPHLENYSGKMHLFLTLSTPHLGIKSHSSNLVKAGIWVLKTWSKSRSLTQLSMDDTANPRDGYIYKLSEIEGLNWFKHFVLLSSSQDNYVPFESARIEVNESQTQAEVYHEIVRNLLEKI